MQEITTGGWGISFQLLPKLTTSAEEYQIRQFARAPFKHPQFRDRIARHRNP
jgi:hypothetical protein